MGDIDIQVKWDAKQFTDQLEGAATKMLSSLASAINKSARTARREDIKIIAQDIGRPASEFRDATPVIRRASPGNLTATWTVKKKKVGVLGTGTFTPVMSALRGSFSGSTFRLSGGGSSALNIPKAFIMPNKGSGGKGGRGLLFIRTGKSRNAVHAVMAEMPRTAMSQPDAVPRKVWERVANEELAKNVSEAVGRVINGLTSNDEGSD